VSWLLLGLERGVKRLEVNEKSVHGEEGGDMR